MFQSTNPRTTGRKPVPTFVQHCVLGVVKTAAKKRAKAVGRMADFQANWMEFAKPADLNRAFAICVSQSQRHGYLAPGTIQVTSKGKGKVTKHRRGAEEQAKTAEYEALLLAMKGKRARKKAKVIPFPRREQMPERIAANPMLSIGGHPLPIWHEFKIRHGDVFYPMAMTQYRHRTFWVAPAAAVGLPESPGWVAYEDKDGNRMNYVFLGYGGKVVKPLARGKSVFYDEREMLFAHDIAAADAVWAYINQQMRHNPKAKRLGRRSNQSPRGYFSTRGGDTVMATDLKPGIYDDGIVAPVYWVKEWAWERDIEFLSKPKITEGVLAWEKADCHPRFNASVMD
jgi:hypothetical protein